MNKITTKNIQQVLSEIETAYFDIPFDNSKFQNEMFVVASQLTPARAYRAIGLRLSNKIQAVKEYLINNEKSKIDIEEKQYKLTLDTVDEFEKRRIRLDLQQTEEGQKYSEKLLNDALFEIETLYNIFLRLPKYTREQFENEESLHFHLKLEQTMNLTHSSQSAIMNMTVNNDMLSNIIENPAILEDLVKRSQAILQSPEYRQSMLKLDDFSNQLK